jgi:hypothetical protein
VSLHARLDDAQRLWDEGRNESALVLLLTAVAACARVAASGKSRSDRQEFEDYFKSGISVRLSVEFRGEQWPIESVLYKWMRCELVHAGGLPVDLELMPDEGLSVRAGGKPEYVLKVSRGWFDYLMALCRRTLK